jgi:hypothetical protein
LIKIGLASILLIASFGLDAATIDVTVSGRAMPWTWVAGGQNSGFQYGLQNGTAPLIVDAADGLAIAPGLSVTVAEVSGVVATCFDCAIVGGDGWSTSVANGLKGSTGTYYPSAYMRPYPIYLMALVGAFTDPSGTIIGHPFFVGQGPKTLIVPAGASAFQLGFNDDNFMDNLGALNLHLSTQVLPIPEPAFQFLAVLIIPLISLTRRFS